MQHYVAYKHHHSILHPSPQHFAPALVRLNTARCLLLDAKGASTLSQQQIRFCVFLPMGALDSGWPLASGFWPLIGKADVALSSILCFVGMTFALYLAHSA